MTSGREELEVGPLMLVVPRRRSPPGPWLWSSGTPFEPSNGCEASS